MGEGTPKYTGTITTSGSSEAIRLEKTVFRAHPEFCQRAKVTATVIAPGQMLISLVEDGPRTQADTEDPILGAFLSFLERDMTQAPQRLEPLSAGSVAAAVELTRDVSLDDEERLPDDATL